LADTLRGCVPFPVDFQAIASPLPNSLYFIAGNDTLFRNDPPFRFSRDYTQPADYLVRLVARSDTSCQTELRDSLVVLARNIPSPRTATENYCAGDTLELNAHYIVDGNRYSWTPNPTFSSDSLSMARFRGGSIDSASVAITSAFGCNTFSRFYLNPIRLQTAFSFVQSYDSCADERRATFQNLSPVGPTFSWDFANGIVSNEVSPTTSFPGNGTYNVSLLATQGNCVDSIQRPVVFNNQPVVFEPVFDFEKVVSGCNESPLIKLKNMSVNIDSSFWNLGNGTTSLDFEPQFTYAKEGTFSVSLEVKRGACLKTTSKEISSKKLLVPNVVTSFADGKNDTYQLIDIGPDWKVSVFNRHGIKVFESDSYENNWPNEKVKPGTYFIKVQSPFNKGCNHWLEVLGE